MGGGDVYNAPARQQWLREFLDDARKREQQHERRRKEAERRRLTREGKRTVQKLTPPVEGGSYTYVTLLKSQASGFRGAADEVGHTKADKLGRIKKVLRVTRVDEPGSYKAHPTTKYVEKPTGKSVEFGELERVDI